MLVAGYFVTVLTTVLCMSVACPDVEVPETDVVDRSTESIDVMTASVVVDAGGEASNVLVTPAVAITTSAVCAAELGETLTSAHFLVMWSAHGVPVIRTKSISNPAVNKTFQTRRRLTDPVGMRRVVLVLVDNQNLVLPLFEPFRLVQRGLE